MARIGTTTAFMSAIPANVRTAGVNHGRSSPSGCMPNPSPNACSSSNGQTISSGNAT
jgi:hypothetical protein